MGLEQYTKRQRDQAYRKLQTVFDVQRKAAAKGYTVKKACSLIGVNINTYNRWNRAYKINGIESLIDRKHERKLGHRKITPEAFAFICKIMRSQNQPQLRTVYYEYYLPFCDSVVPTQKPVSYNTLRNAWSGDVSALDKEYFRAGPTAFRSNNPYIERALNDLEFGEMVVSDHFQVDRLIKMPNDDLVYPWVTGWEDLGTRKYIGWHVSLQPNSDTINYSMYNWIKKYGLRSDKVVVCIDNGRDYKSKVFMGVGYNGKTYEKFRLELDESMIRGIYGNFGMDVILGQPYNAQTKPVEPLHRTFHAFERLYYGYRGTGPEHRPEYMQGRIAGGVEIDSGRIPTLAEFEAELDYVIDSYHHKIHNGLGMSPEDAYECKLETYDRRDYSDAKLTLLMARAYTDLKPVHSMGIRIGSKATAVWYFNDILTDFYREKVIVKYDPRKQGQDGKPEKLFIYTNKDKFLCEAFRREKAHAYKAGPEVFAWNKHEEKHRKERATVLAKQQQGILDDYLIQLSQEDEGVPTGDGINFGQS